MVHQSVSSEGSNTERDNSQPMVKSTVDSNSNISEKNVPTEKSNEIVTTGVVETSEHYEDKHDNDDVRHVSHNLSHQIEQEIHHNISQSMEQDKQESEEEEEDDYLDFDKKRPCCDRRTILSTMIVAILTITGYVVFIVFNDTFVNIADMYAGFMKDQPFLAIVLFMALYIICTPLCIPSTVFVLFGAYIFGNAFGFWTGFLMFVLVDYVCLLIGCQLAFI